MLTVSSILSMSIFTSKRTGGFRTSYDRRTSYFEAQVWSRSIWLLPADWA